MGNVANVTGVENIIKFCLKYGKRLIHLSTLNVSGNTQKAQRIIETPENINAKKIFTENNLYIGQELTDTDVISKFETEIKILEAIYNGLDAQILRLGNITNRYSDGLFEHEPQNNKFAQKLKAYIEIGAFPRDTINPNLEFTPVDLMANAIIKILNHTSDCNVFHIAETKLLPISSIVQTANEIGIDIVPLPDRLMSDVISSILSDDSRACIISNILEDLNDDNKLLYTSSIELRNDFTENYLKNCGFRWKKLDKNYIIKLLNYFKNIGLIHF